MTPNPNPMMQPSPEKKKTSNTAVVLLVVAVVGCFGVGIIGILAAIAIPNFIRFQARAKQSECKVNLKALHTAEEAFFSENDAYTTDPQELGFRPDPGNRYSYFLSEDQVLPADPKRAKDAARFPSALAREGIAVGREGTCPDCSYTAACVGNIDSDDRFDVWTVSSKDRTAPDGMPIKAGAPFNDVNDVTEY